MEPSAQEVDHTLNDGYAHALELEASRSRLSRRISELAEIAHQEGVAEKLREHAAALRDTERELARVRGLLAEVESLAGRPEARLAADR